MPRRGSVISGRGEKRSSQTKNTMRDVARLAGVSVSTVSAVINGTPKVSPTRTQQVQDAMRTLRYQPDQIARSLKVGRTRTIGVVVPDLTNAFYPEVIRGIEEAARGAKYEVLLCDANEDPAQEQAYLTTLFARRVDGVILACSDAAGAYDELQGGVLPLVFVDRIPKNVRRNSVSTDNVKAARIATKHLIQLGHKRIAVLAGDLRYSTHADRLSGLCLAMEDAGIPTREEYLRSGNLQLKDGYLAGIELLRLQPRPTAVIASNNKLLLGLLSAINECRLKCPDEISVLAFDDHVWNQHFTPTLTSVAQPTHEIGRRAFEMLLSRINGTAPRVVTSPVLLDAELKVRGSTGRPSRKTHKS